MTTREWNHRGYTEREVQEWLAWIPNAIPDRAAARLESAKRLELLTPAAIQRIEQAMAAAFNTTTQQGATT